MDPKAMASMSKMMGREVSEGEMEKMQSMMRRSQQLKAPSWRRHSAPYRLASGGACWPWTCSPRLGGGA